MAPQRKAKPPAQPMKVKLLPANQARAFPFLYNFTVNGKLAHRWCLFPVSTSDPAVPLPAIPSGVLDYLAERTDAPEPKAKTDGRMDEIHVSEGCQHRAERYFSAASDGSIQIRSLPTKAQSVGISPITARGFPPAPVHSIRYGTRPHRLHPSLMHTPAQSDSDNYRPSSALTVVVLCVPFAAQKKRMKVLDLRSKQRI